MSLFTTVLTLALLAGPQMNAKLRPFSDSDYQKLLAQRGRVLIYAFSPQMNLSIEGIGEIRRAAADLNARVVFVADPAAKAAEVLGLKETRELGTDLFSQGSRTLRNAGLQLHYPSVIVLNGGRIAGPPIPGFKSRVAYVTLVAEMLKIPTSDVFELTASLDLPRRMNAFFKPVYGTDFIFSGSANPSYLFNLRTGATYDLNDSGDPGATVDGAFLTTLHVTGLSWYSVADVLAGIKKSIHYDPGLRTYQSMGLLPGTATYRVLGAETSSTRPTGLVFRDFAATTNDNGQPRVTGLGRWARVCDGRNISIPMLSKTGLSVSGMFDGTLRVFNIGADGRSCDETFDSAVFTGKADFSADDHSLIYVNVIDNADAVTMADLRSKRSKAIYVAPAESSLAFPGFMSPDRIVVYEERSRKLLVLDRNRKVSISRN